MSLLDQTLQTSWIPWLCADNCKAYYWSEHICSRADHSLLYRTRASARSCNLNHWRCFMNTEHIMYCVQARAYRKPWTLWEPRCSPLCWCTGACGLSRSLSTSNLCPPLSAYVSHVQMLKKHIVQNSSQDWHVMPCGCYYVFPLYAALSFAGALSVCRG